MMMMRTQMQRSAVVSRRSLVVRATNATPPPPPPPGPPVVPTPPPVVPVATPVPIAAPTTSITEAMAFSGPAPEIINGRLAMLGFMAAIGGEAASHTTLLSQADAYAIPIGATFAIFMAASFVPILKGANLMASSGIWTREAEVKNGRMAMLGITAWLLLEWHAGMPMTNVTWEIFTAAHA